MKTITWAGGWLWGKRKGEGVSQPEMDKLFLRNLFLSTRVLQGLEFMINGCFPRSRKMVKKHREIGSPPLIQALVAKRAFIVIPNHPSSVSIAWSRADLSCEPGFCRSVLSLALLHHILHHSTTDPSTIYVALCMYHIGPLYNKVYIWVRWPLWRTFYPWFV